MIKHQLPFCALPLPSPRAAPRLDSFTALHANPALPPHRSSHHWCARRIVCALFFMALSLEKIDPHHATSLSAEKGGFILSSKLINLFFCIHVCTFDPCVCNWTRPPPSQIGDGKPSGGGRGTGDPPFHPWIGWIPTHSHIIGSTIPPVFGLALFFFSKNIFCTFKCCLFMLLGNFVRFFRPRA